MASSVSVQSATLTTCVSRTSTSAALPPVSGEDVWTASVGEYVLVLGDFNAPFENHGNTG